jgi:hypothetical protein
VLRVTWEDLRYDETYTTDIVVPGRSGSRDCFEEAHATLLQHRYRLVVAMSQRGRQAGLGVG